MWKRRIMTIFCKNVVLSIIDELERKGDNPYQIEYFMDQRGEMNNIPKRNLRSNDTLRRIVVIYSL